MKKTKIFQLVLFVVVLAALSTVGLLYVSAYELIKHLHLEGLEPSITLAFDLFSMPDPKIELYSKLSVGASFVLPILVFGAMLWSVLAPKKQELHGSAKLAGRIDLAKAGLLSADKPDDKYPSVILGKYQEQFLLCRGQQFMFLSAPTGSGKGVGIVIPNCLHYRDSMVVYDTKGENFDKTAGFRAKCGQKVYKFSPDDEDFITDCWNPLGYVRDDPRFRISDLMSITTILYPPSDDDVWSSTSENLFLGLALYIMETSKLSEDFNMSSIKRFAVTLDCLKDEATLMSEVERRKDFEPLSEDCVTYLRAYAQTSEKVRNSIMISFNKPLGVFADPITARATSKNTFDLRDVRKQRMTIYVVIKPSKIAKFSKLINLFFEQLLVLNMDKEPADDPSLKYQCLLMLDEFPSMGRVAILEKASAFMRSYNMRLLLIFQSKGQLKDSAMYGDNGTQNLLTNMAVQVAYAPRDDVDAKDYSEMIGQMTVKSKSKSKHLTGASNRSESESDHARSVLMPQEVKEIGADNEIISMEHMKPALVSKVFWYKEPAFIARANLAVPEIPDQSIGHNTIERGREPVATHFGGSINEQLLPAGASFEVGFSPQRNALEVVMSHIIAAEKELLVAAYSFTSKEVSHALTEAKARGIDVRVVVDSGQNNEEQSGYKAVDYLESQGIPVFRCKNYAAMHHKFIVADGKHIQLGSFNYTASANLRNAETAIVFRNVEDLAAIYGIEWLRLTTDPVVSPDIIMKVDRGRAKLMENGLIL
jgi:type IV secretion system protein VirD4